MLLHLSVILSTGQVSAIHPPGQILPFPSRDPPANTLRPTPPGRHPLGRHSSWANTPLGRYPLGRHPQTDTPPRDTPGKTPPGQTPPPVRHPKANTPPQVDTPSPWWTLPQQTATAADGTHPTGINYFYK